MMRDNWGIDISTTLPGDIRPSSTGGLQTWNLKLLALLAVLSECTHGQGDIVGALLVDAAHHRVSKAKNKDRK